MNLLRLLFQPLLVVLGLGLISVATDAKPLSKPSEKKIAIIHSRLALVPKVTGGILVGDAADALEMFDSDFSAKFLYGAGLSAEYYFVKRFATFIQFEMDFKDIPRSNLKPLRGTSWGIGGLVKVVPERKSSLYVKGEIGRVKVVIPDYYSAGAGQSPDLEFGPFSYYRIGVGLVNFTSSRNNIRSELYYKTISSDNEQIPGFGRVISNVSYVGIDIAWGIGLFGFK